jgi:hypothetical protein
LYAGFPDLFVLPRSAADDVSADCRGVDPKQPAVLRNRVLARVAVAVLVDAVSFLVVDLASTDRLFSQPRRGRPGVGELLLRQDER